jgi:hypothetical protein
MTFGQTLKRRKSLALLILFLSFPLSCVTGACGAYRRPAALTADERRLLESVPIPYDVSVVPWDKETDRRRGQNPEAYARPLAKLLAASHAFRSTRLEQKASSAAHLVATSTGAHCNTAIVPLFTIVSLGVIPTVFEDEECQGMTLRSAKSLSSNPVEISLSQTHTVVMGWVALPLGALPGWSHGDFRRDDRYRKRFRLEVIRHRAAIDRLVH